MESMYSRAPSDNRLIWKGKWASPFVPKGGWVCFRWEDLGDAQKGCEMCESQTIRYVHHMWHPHHKSLEVGCICAGYMEGSLLASKFRQTALQKRKQERKRWVSLRSWKEDAYGTGFTKRLGGYAVVLTKCGHGWTVAFYMADLEHLIDRSEKAAFKTLEEAKLHAFDYLDPYSDLILPEGRIMLPFLRQTESYTRSQY